MKRFYSLMHHHFHSYRKEYFQSRNSARTKTMKRRGDDWLFTVAAGTIFLLILWIFIAASHAQASVFVWQDPQSGISLSYPDRWSIVQNRHVGDEITIQAPVQGDHASCRVQIHEDRRFVIYPHRYASAVQNTAYGQEFWDGFLGQYNQVAYSFFDNDAGLGRGFASLVDVSYITEAPSEVKKRAIAAVSLYHDRAYLIECSSAFDAFDRWYHPFLSVIKSVDFNKINQQHPMGHYRNFLGGQLMIVGTDRKRDITIY